MRQKIKLLSYLLLIIFFTNCEKEEVVNENENNFIPVITSSKISFSELNNEIETPRIKAILQSELFYSLNNNAFSRTTSSESIFTKIQKKDSLTTYVLYLNSYTVQKPYFLKFIITKNINESEKMGYLKYIPTTATATLDLATFSGEVQVLNSSFEVTASSKYSNGIKQISNSNNDNSNRTVCTDEIVITEVRCSHGGLHGVGGTCHDPFGNVIPNDAHYVVSIFTRCTTRGDQPVQIIEDTNSTSNGTGGVYPASIFLNPFLNTLTQEELVVYYSNPAIQTYLVNNLVVVPTPNYDPQLGGDSTMVIIEPEAEEFVEQLIKNSVETGLTFDLEKSLKSPVNIDFSEIDTSTPEGQKLDCIYKKLTNSPEFKRLFDGTFGGDQLDLNIKFKMQANLTDEDGNPVKALTIPVAGPQGSNGIYQDIIFNTNYLSGSANLSNISLAKTIIHEYIHAYLNVRYVNIDNGVSLTFLANETLEELMYYAFNPQNNDPLDTGINHHDFMYVHMIPVFKTIFSEIVNELLSPQDITNANNNPITDVNGNFIENFDFQNLYTYLAYEGLHNTHCYVDYIENNLIELTKYEEYTRYARNSSQDCQ